MSNDFEERKHQSAERLKLLFEDQGNERTIKPTDNQIIRSINPPTITLTSEEAQAETDATTFDDYDDWIVSAMIAREAGKIQLDQDGKTVEHPTTRLFRLGIESINEGKPSPLFLILLEKIAERATNKDVLHLVFPEEFTKIAKVSMDAADNYAGIVDDFKRFIQSHSKSNLSYSEIKALFKKHPTIPPKELDRALTAHGINWKGKSGRKAKPKTKKEGW